MTTNIIEKAFETLIMRHITISKKLVKENFTRACEMKEIE